MRIISQDGMIDVPYEQVSIEQKENDIWCGYSSTMKQHCTGKLFAKYSTAEKAQKAMDMLHEEYKKFQTTKTGSGFYFAFDYPKVFQFPQDSEIEV